MNDFVKYLQLWQRARIVLKIATTKLCVASTLVHWDRTQIFVVVHCLISIILPIEGFKRFYISS